MHNGLTILIALGLLGAKAPRTPSTFSATPLVDFQPGQRYLGQFEGWLYDGSNSPPADYDAYGRTVAASVVPLDASGNPSASGRIVFSSAGMSNARREWCGTPTTCTTVGGQPSLMGAAATSAQVNHTTLRIVNGADNSQVSAMWTCAYGLCGGAIENEYDRIRDVVLTPAGLTEDQVQAVWFYDTPSRHPAYSLPDARAEAYQYEADLGQIVRAMATRWRNVRMLVLTPREYAGYAGTWTQQGIPAPEPMEPFAYENGFAVKWLIAAKIRQWRDGTIDARAGDLSALPFIWWSVGTYTWGNGVNNPSQSLALSWSSIDFLSDAIHQAVSGISKEASRLLGAFLVSPYLPWLHA